MENSFPLAILIASPFLKDGLKKPSDDQQKENYKSLPMPMRCDGYCNIKGCQQNDLKRYFISTHASSECCKQQIADVLNRC